MTLKLLLDTNVLARICQPTRFRDVQRWFQQMLERGAAAPELLVSVLADYELRRKLLEVDATESLVHLDTLAKFLRYVPVTAEVARRAAELRQSLFGELAQMPLSDADLLMAAQAAALGATIVTSDKALLRIPSLAARDWSEIGIGSTEG